MKIGIIGLGSIGQRHALCLKKLGVNDIVALRSNRGAKRISDEFDFIKFLYDEKEFYSEKVDGVIISNPTAFHVQSMVNPLELNLPIFVEKPLSNHLDELKKIEKYDKSKIQVGYCFRYNPLINKIKDILMLNKIGEIIKANLYCGQYLPIWHTYTDYTQEYFARKDLGGGALRTLSHEIDISNFLFGPSVEVLANISKISDLEIDVDDNAQLFLKHDEELISCIELDFLNPLSERYGSIFGTKGYLKYSLSDSKITLANIQGDVETVYNESNPKFDEMYLNQMKSFVDMIKGERKSKCGFKDGLSVMKIIDASEKSSDNKKDWIKV